MAKTFQLKFTPRKLVSYPSIKAASPMPKVNTGRAERTGMPIEGIEEGKNPPSPFPRKGR